MKMIQKLFVTWDDRFISCPHGLLTGRVDINEVKAFGTVTGFPVCTQVMTSKRVATPTALGWRNTVLPIREDATVPFLEVVSLNGRQLEMAVSDRETPDLEHSPRCNHQSRRCEKMKWNDEIRMRDVGMGTEECERWGTLEWMEHWSFQKKFQIIRRLIDVTVTSKSPECSSYAIIEFSSNVLTM